MLYYISVMKNKPTHRNPEEAMKKTITIGKIEDQSARDRVVAALPLVFGDVTSARVSHDWYISVEVTRTSRQFISQVCAFLDGARAAIGELSV